MDNVQEPAAPAPNEVQTAQKTVGSTPKDRARWLLNFSQVEEQILKSHQMRVECAVFLDRDLHARMKKDGKVGQRQLPPDTEVRRWKRELNGWLEQLRQHQVTSVEARGTVAVNYNDNQLTEESTLVPVHPADTFALEAIKTLAAVKDYFQFCQNEKCTRPFVRNGRQDYCFPRCCDTVNHRKYRNGLKAKAETALEQPQIP
jgi:hypothetical protein